MAIVGTAGNDVLNGTAGRDKFKLFQGGNDTVGGGVGNDTFVLNAALTAADAIDGGAGGKDKAVLLGDYSAGLVFGASTMTNVETLRLGGAFDYSLVTHDATVAAGARLTVDARTLGAGHDLTFIGSAETNGRFNLLGSAGNDSLTGGAQTDTISGGAGADALFGGGGADSFVYAGASESASAACDEIFGLDANSDKFDFTQAVTGFDGVLAMSVTTLNFDTDLAFACFWGGMQAGHAVVVSGDPGSRFNGLDFLVIDADGSGGYTPGADYVIDVTGFSGTFDAGDFI
jgi:Ca2+-binding RTX toxin-like protein